jgi:hypothetical protein
MRKQTKALETESPSGPLAHNPFAGIKALLKERQAAAPPAAPERPPSILRKKSSPRHGEDSREINPEEERGLFREAMKDVAPLSRERERGMGEVDPLGKRNEREIRRDISGENLARPSSPTRMTDENRESLEQLTRLVTTGEGFILSLTPEYIEGTGYNIHSEYARRLHAGDFSIQAHIDLHSTLWRHDVLEGEKSCRFPPLFIAPETRKILIITTASRTTSRPSSGSMTIISHGSTASGDLIWRRSFTGTSTAAICTMASPA